MMPTREQVYEAIFALTNGVEWNIGTDLAPVMQGFNTRTRRIALFSDVPSEQQPWIGQAEHDEQSLQTTNLPYIRTWKVRWLIYHRKGDDPSSVPAIWNNLIIDALEAALVPPPQDPGFFDQRNTLSGLVYHCFIDGEIFKDPGDIDNQALIIIPITLLVP